MGRYPRFPVLIFSNGHFSMILGEFKQEIMRLHNKVNLDIFGQGLRWQKVEILDDKVVIIANNKRVSALRTLDPKDRLTTQLIDLSLLVEFKNRFRMALETTLKLPFTAVLKDYDPESETSMCIVFLNAPVKDLLPDLAPAAPVE
jgi:hypothetical protein